jgi:hypothetical protein
MKDALMIALIVLLLIISIIIGTLVVTGDIPIFTIICPILFLIGAPLFIMTRYSSSKNPSHGEEFPKGKLSLDEFNRWSDKQWTHFFKFIILPCLILIILLIIFGIAVAITS